IARGDPQGFEIVEHVSPSVIGAVRAYSTAGARTERRKRSGTPAERPHGAGRAFLSSSDFRGFLIFVMDGRRAAGQHRMCAEQRCPGEDQVVEH
ncbi:MAG: hypothetical protein VW405_13230, partial [Rhodospirillaceae bacterium]